VGEVIKQSPEAAPDLDGGRPHVRMGYRIFGLGMADEITSISTDC